MSAEFLEVIRAHGLIPGRQPVPDGKWYRCPTENHPKKKNGAFKLTLDARVGFYWDLAIDGKVITWKADGFSSETVPREVDHAAIKRQQEEQRAAQRRATDAAQAFYDRCQPLRGGHPYLEAHGLDMTGCVGLKIDSDGWLVIPAMRQGSLISLQRIAPPGAVPEDEPTKKFWFGAPFGGVSYLVDRPGASITVLCEGLATGLAIYAAAPLTRVLVAFTGGNMKKIAERFPFTGMVAVAADNDHRTICQPHKKNGSSEPFSPWEKRPDWCTCNPGRCYAAEAAQVLGCGVMLPEGITGTDWADLRQERVKERMRKRDPRRHETESTIRRAVDAEVAMAVMRAARPRIVG